MKINHHLLASWAILACLIACKPVADAVSPDPTNGQPPVQTDGITQVGEPNGESISQVIGPEGGTLTTEDNRIQLVIPAGALDKPTPITIQPITNYTPNGIGQAYRFSPDGTKFSKPATLTFRYTTSMVSANVANAFSVAYQRADHIWYSVPGVKADINKQEIVAPMSHFSDWSAVEANQLRGLSDLEANQLEDFGIYGNSFYDIVGYGESQSFWVGQVPDPDDKSEKPLIPKLIYNENWSVLGPGTIKATGDKATYTAPTYILPKANPVTIQAEVYFENSKTKLILMRQVIVGSGFVQCRFHGQEYLFTDVSVDQDGVKAYLPSEGNNSYIFLYTYGMKAGNFPFGSTQPGTGQIQLNTKAADGYDSFPGSCYDNPVVTSGSVKVSVYEPGTLIGGTFEGHLLEQKVNHCGSSAQGDLITGYFVLRSK